MVGNTEKTGQPLAVNRPKRNRLTRDDLELSLLGLPAFIWYVLFCYLPMFGLIIAFKQYKIFPRQSFLYNLFHSEFVGFKNFSFFIHNNAFAMLLRNTLLYNIVFIILGIVIPVTLAVMINELYSKRASKTYQTLMFFPYFLSWVVAAYFLFAFLDPDYGTLNRVIMFFGGEPHRWYSEATYWPLFFVILKVWKGTGYGMVVYLATITGIDQSLYEAAMLDGANKLQRVWHITLPALIPTAVTLFILNLGSLMSVGFEKAFAMQNDLNRTTAQVLSTYVYTQGLVDNNYSFATAVDLFNSVINLVAVVTVNYIGRKTADVRAPLWKTQ